MKELERTWKLLFRFQGLGLRVGKRKWKLLHSYGMLNRDYDKDPVLLAKKTERGSWIRCRRNGSRSSFKAFIGFTQGLWFRSRCYGPYWCHREDDSLPGEQRGMQASSIQPLHNATTCQAKTGFAELIWVHLTHRRP